MSNINGKVYAMNCVTPMKPWKTPILRLVFFILWHVKSKQQDLINLSFIEFARWVIIPRNALPFVANGQQKGESEIRLSPLLQQLQWHLEPVHRRLLRGPQHRLESHLALEREVSRLGPRNPLQAVHRQVQFDTDYYYTAYPYATANDLKAAHIVQQASLDQLSQHADRSLPNNSPQPICNSCFRCRRISAIPAQLPLVC